MKIVLVVLSLVIAISASPTGDAVIGKLSTCFSSAGVVSIPQIVLNVTIPIFGFLKMYVDAEVDCLIISAAVQQSIELYLNESTTLAITNFDVELEATIQPGFFVNAHMAIEIPPHEKLGVGTCVVLYKDLEIHVEVTGTYPVGFPSSCSIIAVNLTLNTTGASIVSTGYSLVDIIIRQPAGTPFFELLLAAIEARLQEILIAGCT